jgi:signal peptidase I
MRTWLQILAWLIGGLGVVLLGLYLFFFDVWTVPADDPLLSASIEPTLSAGEFVVVTRRTTVDRGNLVRCDDPQAAGRYIVGRAMGKFGDKLEIQGEVVLLDGKHTPSPRACDTPNVNLFDPQTNEDVSLVCSAEEYGEMAYSALRSEDHPEPPTRPVSVLANRWFLVSDDRHVHLDSRDFGQIDPATCQHIVYRVVGAAGFGDTRKRLSIIW